MFHDELYSRLKNPQCSNWSIEENHPVKMAITKKLHQKCVVKIYTTPVLIFQIFYFCFSSQPKKSFHLKLTKTQSIFNSGLCPFWGIDEIYSVLTLNKLLLMCKK